MYGSLIPPTNQVRNLGPVFDKHLTMRAQVNSICRIAFVHLRNIGRVRGVLSQEATQRLVHAFITSRVDCCNPLRCGVSQSLTDKLQRMLNSAARTVTITPKFAHMTHVCGELHWLLCLPVRAARSWSSRTKPCTASLRTISAVCARWYQSDRALSALAQQSAECAQDKTQDIRTGSFPTQHPFCETCCAQPLAGHHSWLRLRPELKTLLFDKSYI